MKPTIFSFLIVFIFSFNTVLFSQHGSSADIKPPNVNPANMAGIMMYDSDESIKKIKIKNDIKKSIVLKSISVYNNKINEIKTFNYDTFDNIKSFITKKFNEAKLTNDYRSLADVQIKVQEMLNPVRTKVEDQQGLLNASLEKELTAKQYKSWIKYQKVQLKKLDPKAQQTTPIQSNHSSQRRGQGRGRNERRY